MPAELSDLPLILGRLLLGGLFVFGGVQHYFIAPMLVQVMTARGIPAPKLVLAMGSVFQTVFGLLLMLGIFVAPAALALVLFTLVASWMFLNFWSLSGPERETALHGLVTNVGIVGGLLIAAATAR